MANSKRSTTGGLKKLAGKTFNVADKLLTGAGAVADAIGKVAPSVVDEGAKVIDAHLDKHKKDFKMPGLIDLPLAEAERVMHFYHLQYSLIQVAPAEKYAGRRANVVLDTTPKANAKVAPNSFVRAEYADEDTIEASRQLLASRHAEKKMVKASRHALRQARAQTVAHLVTGIPKAVGNQLPHRKTKKSPTAPSNQTKNDPQAQ